MPDIAAAAERCVSATIGQRQLWFLERLGHSHTVLFAVRMWGTLDVDATKRALVEIVRRHEVLRSGFIRADRRLLLVPRDAPRLQFEEVDVRSLGEEAVRVIKTQDILRSHRDRAFDLEHDDLLRAILVRLGDADHVLGCCMHHIASDGWSCRVLANEFAILYDAFTQGHPTPLADLDWQYRDVAAFWNSPVGQAKAEAALEYWQARLESYRPLSLPAVAGSRGCSIARMPQSDQVEDALWALAARERVTMFVVWLAALAVALANHTGTRDLLIGVSVSNRLDRRSERLIGLFVNWLPLRLELTGSPSFHDAIVRGRRATIEALAHQDAPFQAIVERINPPRVHGRNPLIDVIVNFEHVEPNRLALRDLRVEPFEVSDPQADVSLILNITQCRSRLVSSFVYRHDLFSHASVSALTDHLSNALRAAAFNPDAVALSN